MAGDTVLAVRGLKIHFATGDGVIKAVDGVDFEVRRGEVLGIVGESGSGKSVTGLAIMRLVPSPPGRIVAGEIRFEGTDLLGLPADAMRRHRGDRISMIFQDPLTSLNPVLTVGTQVAEVFRFHRRHSKRASWEQAVAMLRAADIPSPASRAASYPHQLSGGMRQRAMISMALGCEPALLIADEPTTALDVTVQAQILGLIKDLCRERGTAVILITHDMGVVAQMCDRVAVMYAGHLMESTDVWTLFKEPLHPYTAALLRSLPRLGTRRDRLESIQGVPPRADRLPPGCPFAPRCGLAEPRCAEALPALVPVRSDHLVRCVKVGARA